MTPRRILLVYAALALATAFYPAFFFERPAPLQSSTLYLPDPRVPPERNDELSDVVTQFVPWSRAVADAYRRGQMPLRFASNGCGTPLWANPQAQAVTPTTIFFLLLPAAWASAAAAAVKLFAAAAGTFFFCRARGLSIPGSLWAGLAYGFTIHATTWIHFPHTWPVALFPWVLLALERSARGKPRGFAATFAVVLLLLAGGYPETEFLVALCGSAYFAALLISEHVPGREKLRRLGLTAGASLLALGVTAVYTLPATLAIVRGQRSIQVARHAQTVTSPFSPRYLFRPPTYWEITRFWVVPEAQGNPRDQDKFGPYSFAGRSSGYAGILVLAFALSTFFWRRPPRFVAAARWAALLVALYVLWYPPLVWLLQRTPGIREAALRLTTNRANTILVLLLALLAAFELDRIRAGGPAARTRAALLIVLFATGLVTLEYARAGDRPPLTAWRAVSFIVPVVLLVAALWLLAGRMQARRNRALAALLLIGTGVDLLRIGARFNPGTRPEDEYPVSPKLRELQSAAAGGRFASWDPTLTGMAYPYGLEDVRSLNPVGPADYEDVLIATAGYTGPEGNVPRVTRMEAPFLEFLNVRARLGSGTPILTTSAPPAILPDRLLGVRDASELLGRLARETDFLRQAFVLGQDESFSGNASVLSFRRPRAEELRIRVRTDSPRVLIVPETDDGGWRAVANGSRLTTFTANGAFLGVRVPAGETEIVCRYQPPGFRTGLAISVVTAAFVTVFTISRRSRSLAQPGGKSA